MHQVYFKYFFCYCWALTCKFGWVVRLQLHLWPCQVLNLVSTFFDFFFLFNRHAWTGVGLPGSCRFKKLTGMPSSLYLKNRISVRFPVNPVRSPDPVRVWKPWSWVMQYLKLSIHFKISEFDIIKSSTFICKKKKSWLSSICYLFTLFDKVLN